MGGEGEDGVSMALKALRDLRDGGKPGEIQRKRIWNTGRKKRQDL